MAILAFLAIAINYEVILNKGLYIGMLLLLVIASLGFPLPEDIPLLAGGACARLQEKELIYVIIVGLIGVMSGDIILYSAGRRFGRDILKHRPLRSFVTPEHVAQMEIQFDKRGNWIIFLGRFFAGIRSVMCVTAGLCKVPMWKFVLIDLSGALCSVPLLILIGWYFSENIKKISAGVGVAEKIIGAAVAIVVICWVFYIHVSKRSKIRQLDKGTKQAFKGQGYNTSKTSSEVRADGKADDTKI
jgi:membrane protein DedA with SNARE-associated domain